MKYLQSWAWSSVGQFICTNFLPASGGSLPHVAKLIDEFLFDFFDQRVLQEACERGAHVQELEFILERTTPDWREVVKSAIRGGYLHVFHWMTERQDFRGPWEIDLSRGLIVAAEYGRLDLFKLLVAKGADCNGCKEIVRAAANGHLEMVKWLYEDKGRNGCANVLIEAAENGHLEVVQWLHKNIDMQFKGSETTCMMRAAGNGHLEVLKWFHQRHSNVCRSVVMDSAAGAGHLHVTQWLLENCSEGCSPNGIWRAASTGNMAMLRWLDKHFSSNFTARAMDSAAGNNQLEVVKWLHENRSEGCTTQAMDNAALNGDLETIKWLQANRTEGCSRLAMDWAARNGHLHVVRWLHENRSEGCTIGAMNEAARRGHLKVVRFLYENRTEGCSDGVLEDAAWAGYLEMVQYLDGKTQQRAHWWGLGDASKRGRLELLLVLLSKGPSELFFSKRPAMILRFYNEVFDELQDQNGAMTSVKEHEILKFLSRLHADSSKLEMCVTAMLDIALQRGCRRLVWRFFDRRRMHRYVEVAGNYEHIAFLRWAVENGARLGAATSTRLATHHVYKELTRFLCEADRVEVLSTLMEAQLWSAIWILNNTRFTETSSRVAISKAANKVRSASYICGHVNDETRSWCFPSSRED